jgi:signal transduction histidine kinase
MLIGECEQRRTWTAYELELVKAVAGQVAIAIEHARLVDRLVQKNEHLDAKNLELRTVQSQMIHHEKMASLGRLVAGIAHELNNPINFVHGNLPYLRQYFADIKQMIEALSELPDEYKAKLDEQKKRLKYDFVITDLDNIIADLEEGAERIRYIIRNLRSFSRLDHADLKEANIQEGIESTLKILNQYYGRDKIPIEISFAEMPPILCYPGQLNQVWMNLLSNAAQALGSVAEPKVIINGEVIENCVLVSVADNGPGIKQQDQSKIFEPFFTTKPVGQGTGLGLSICHSIMERHGGQIWFESVAGAGTTFKVRIPLRAQPAEPVMVAEEV